jgi:DNA-binding ferritin-like protein
LFDTRNDLPAPTRDSIVALLNARLADAVDESATLADDDTSDRFTKISRGTDKPLWVVKAHVQK